ncbi:hypothetical protein [Streptomyces sp. LMG1-1-1.1]|uniref:hypothetical protein n=1 Tax=Streptomyces sp. LMG1-1-1.1 TaxID=3135245 RepID=UPI0034670E50
MDVDKVTDELYALKPAEFVPARDRHVAQAREAGDAAAAKAIAALRRPSLAAWAANLLARKRLREAQDFLTLGETLREAHRTLDAERLRAAGSRQHQLVTMLAREAADLAREAGQPLSDTVSYEVEQTLHAVLADPDVAAQWSKARLVKPPSAAVGFPAAAPEAVAARSSEAHPTPPPGKAGRASRGTAGRTASEEAGRADSGNAGHEASGRAGRTASGKAGRTAPAEARTATSEPSRELAQARVTAEEAVAAAGLRERDLHEARDARRATAGQAEEAADRVRHLEQELRAARRTARDAAAADAEAGTAVTAAELALRDARGAATRAAREVERLER